jgi:Zn-dependent protease
VHWSFAALVVLVVVLVGGAGMSTVLAALGWLALLFGSVVLHELGHSLVARRRGLAVHDIVLLPIGGVSEIPDLTRSSEDELAIAAAGPLTSAGLALVLGVLGALTGAALWPPSLLTGSILVRVAWMNVVLAGFNLLPALPMDGGRVLRAWLSRHHGDQWATAVAVRVATMLSAAMIVLGLFVDIWLVLIGIFVLLGAQGESRMSKLKGALGNWTVSDLAVRPPYAILDTVPIGEVFVRYPPFPGPSIPIEGPSGYVGMVSHDALMSAPPHALAGSVAEHVPLLDPKAPLYPTALEAFNAARRNVLPVGSAGHVQGLITAADVEAFLQRAAPARR